MNKRAQVATEYLTIVAFLLIAVAVLAGYGLMSYNQSVVIVKAQNAVSLLKDSAEYVYSLGPGNSVIVDVDLPPGITNSSVENNTIALYFPEATGENVISATTDVMISGSLPTNAGEHSIEVKVVDANVVMQAVG